MQRQAMGVALHIVLLPFFELLHSTIDSYDADFDESAVILADVIQLHHHLLVILLKSGRITQEYFTGIGEFERHMADQERAAKLLLDAGDMSGQRLLCDLQFGCCAGKASDPCNRRKVLHREEVHSSS